MNKFQSYQIVKLSFIAVLLLITPLLSNSMRPPYIYFLTNLLIIALGAEAGLLPAISNHGEDKKPSVVIAPKPIVVADEININTNTTTIGRHESPECIRQKLKAVENSVSEKIVRVVKVNQVKKCPSMPSIFFIGGSDPEPEHIKEDDEEEEEVGGLSGQELFTKAETFIGNFYKQLKIQREDSWNRIHGFYQKAF
ncbi:uncharacterized protein LOC122639873 [Telopea speciosissima]|uniref:uncharacterized protein LOC122639873 n=1 Tax=Telopea speciosissima TaxID=54955 RepID=UPI001CC4C901|nr:uncharacterized protein LOC122639873 [Telopea speciosissima]